MSDIEVTKTAEIASDEKMVLLPMSVEIVIEDKDEMLKLKEMQSDQQRRMSLPSPPAKIAPKTSPIREDPKTVDARSVYIGQVDYSVTSEMLEDHFAGCGAVKRVTIPANAAGHPKGFAYLEFESPDSLPAALLLEGSLLSGRQIKVVAKRSNQPRFSPVTYGSPMASRGRGGSFYQPIRGRGSFQRSGAAPGVYSKDYRTTNARFAPY